MVGDDSILCCLFPGFCEPKAQAPRLYTYGFSKLTLVISCLLLIVHVGIYKYIFRYVYQKKKKIFCGTTTLKSIITGILFKDVNKREFEWLKPSALRTKFTYMYIYFHVGYQKCFQINFYSHSRSCHRIIPMTLTLLTNPLESDPAPFLSKVFVLPIWM